MFVAREHSQLRAALAGQRFVGVAMGTFDGVHRGHQALLQRTMQWAQQHGGVALAMTFDPHPRHVVRPQARPPLLESLSTRLERFCMFGLHGAFVLRFDAAIAAIDAEEFVRRYLGAGLGAKAVVVGENFRFGHKRLGDAALLRRMGASMGFEVSALPAVREAGEIVNSSGLRQLIAQGQLDTAERWLGRKVQLRGPVVHGDARGRTLGYPTANVQPDSDVVPPHGIYAAQAHTPRGLYAAALSIGVHPTFAAASRTKVEAHLLDYPGDALYGETLVLSIVQRLRDEARFDSVPALLTQMQADVVATRQAIARL